MASLTNIQSESFKPTIPKGNRSSVHTDEDDTITIIEKSMLDINHGWMLSSLS